MSRGLGDVYKRQGVRDPAREKSLATSDVTGILNAPALNPLRRVFVFIFNAFEVLDGAGIESKILK